MLVMKRKPGGYEKKTNYEEDLEFDFIFIYRKQILYLVVKKRKIIVYKISNLKDVSTA